VTLFIVMVILMMAQVFWRYYLELPLSWSEEIARYIFIVVTYIGASIAVHEKLHIEINLTDYFTNKYVKNNKKLMLINTSINIAKNIVIFSVSLFFSYYSFNYAIEDYSFEQVSTSVGLPLFIVSGSIFINLVIMAFFAFSQVFINFIEFNKLPLEEHQN